MTLAVDSKFGKEILRNHYSSNKHQAWLKKKKALLAVFLWDQFDQNISL